MSKKKAQVFCPLSNIWVLTPHKCSETCPLTEEALVRVAVPTAERQRQGFLGMAGFCLIWIPNFGLIAKPL